MNAQTNWWETFFEGATVDLWLRAVKPEQTEREADELLRALDVRAGAEILDVPCGGGRLSLAMANRGYQATGVDWSTEFLAHARAQDVAGAVTWDRRNMRDLPWRDRFDGAFCVGNSFGYLDDEGNAAFLRAVAGALKPGARFILETPMVIENLLDHIHHRAWWKLDDEDVYLLAANDYDHTRERLETEYTIISNGRVDVRRGSHQVFTYRALVELFHSAGFDVVLEEPWTREARSLKFIGTRR